MQDRRRRLHRLLVPGALLVGLLYLSSGSGGGEGITAKNDCGRASELQLHVPPQMRPVPRSAVALCAHRGAADGAEILRAFQQSTATAVEGQTEAESKAMAAAVSALREMPFAARVATLCSDHGVCCSDIDVALTTDGVPVAGHPRRDVAALVGAAAVTTTGLTVPWSALKEADPSQRTIGRLQEITAAADAARHDGRPPLYTYEPKAELVANPSSADRQLARCVHSVVHRPRDCPSFLAAVEDGPLLRLAAAMAPAFAGRSLPHRLIADPDRWLTAAVAHFAPEEGEDREWFDGASHMTRLHSPLVAYVASRVGAVVGNPSLLLAMADARLRGAPSLSRLPVQQAASVAATAKARCADRTRSSVSWSRRSLAKECDVLWAHWGYASNPGSGSTSHSATAQDGLPPWVAQIAPSLTAVKLCRAELNAHLDALHGAAVAPEPSTSTEPSDTVDMVQATLAGLAPTDLEQRRGSDSKRPPTGFDCWAVNTAADMNAAMGRGCSHLITDVPVAMMSLLPRLR